MTTGRRFKDPFIICFEGLDGTYKETNAKDLYTHIKNVYKNNVNVQYVSFPRYELPTSTFVVRYLQGAYDLFEIVDKDKYKLKDAKCELIRTASYYYLDMMDYIQKVKHDDELQDHTKPTYIIMDRYFYSMFYYLTPNIYCHLFSNIMDNDKYKNSLYDILTFLQHDMYELPPASLVIKMKTDESTLTQHKLEISRDIYEKSIQYLFLVNETFNNLDLTKLDILNTENYPNPVLEIDTVNKDKNTLHEEIIKKVSEIIF